MQNHVRNKGELNISVYLECRPQYDSVKLDLQHWSTALPAALWGYMPNVNLLHNNNAHSLMRWRITKT